MLRSKCVFVGSGFDATHIIILSGCYIDNIRIDMSKQSKIHSFFKAKTADELEVEELLFTQASMASRATTMETTKSINLSLSSTIHKTIRNR